MNRLYRVTRFTLVELLVVIAIIAVLASILMPALSRAREEAKRIVCVSNMRQLGLASAMYGDDFDCLLPAEITILDGSRGWPFNLSKTSDSRNKFTHHNLLYEASLLDREHIIANGYASSASREKMESLRSQNLLLCPSGRIIGGVRPGHSLTNPAYDRSIFDVADGYTVYQTPWGPSWMSPWPSHQVYHNATTFSSYAVNSHNKKNIGGSVASANAVYVPLKQVRDPSETLFWMESGGPNGIGVQQLRTHYTTNSMSSIIARFPHRGRANYMTMDGAVGILDRSIVVAGSSMPNATFDATLPFSFNVD